eukprot:9750040-Prorocentrum_lima.AAC.1
MMSILNIVVASALDLVMMRIYLDLHRLHRLPRISRCCRQDPQELKASRLDRLPARRRLRHQR